MLAKFEEDSSQVHALHEERTYDDLDDITKQAIDDAFSGRGVKYYSSMDDFFFHDIGVSLS